MQAADIQNIDQIIANSLTSGSIKTSMVIAADPNQDFSSFTTSYQNNIDNGNLDGLTIISSSNTINNQEEATTVSSTISANLGLILGISIPLFISGTCAFI